MTTKKQAALRAAGLPAKAGTASSAHKESLTHAVRPKRRPTKEETYLTSVFVNCPFDDDYLPKLQATLFTISDCGFLPRTALEAKGTTRTRLTKIKDLIQTSRFSIHDLSRVAPDAQTGLPRFNMPFELGLAFGACFFLPQKAGTEREILLMSEQPFQDKKYLSDLAGQDGEYHQGQEVELVRVVRTFLADQAGERQVRGHSDIFKRLGQFRSELPTLVRALPLPVSAEEIRTLDYLNEWVRIASGWQGNTP